MADPRRQRLRAALTAPEIAVVPGATDAFEARLVEQAGFPAVFVTGAGVANTLLGVPDIGLTTLTEVVMVTRNIASAVDLPVLADADTGYGNHLNVRRTVRELEQAGVAAIVLEDQLAPKRCGHLGGNRVIPAEEMTAKLLAAVDARRDPDLVLVARTDARASEGLESAIERASSYAQAGADLIFVEAPRSRDELAAIPGAVPAPCMVNVVEGGLTPVLSSRELHAMGYRVALHANVVLRAAARAVEGALAALRADDGAGVAERLLPWQRRQAVVDLPAWERWDEAIVSSARGLSAAD